MIALLLFACTVRPYGAPVVAPVVEPVAPVVGVSVEPLLARIDALLAASDEVDRRDRLVELRDLVVAAQAMEGRAQGRVLRYAERVVVVEERAQPFAVAEMPMELGAGFEPVVEVGVEVADPLAGARPALAAGRHLEAITICDGLLAQGIGGADVVAVRTAAVEGWVRSESEAAGAALVQARAMPPGPARVEATRAVAARLQAIVARFPESPQAADVQKHLATVQTELGTP